MYTDILWKHYKDDSKVLRVIRNCPDNHLFLRVVRGHPRDDSISIFTRIFTDILWKHYRGVL